MQFLIIKTSAYGDIVQTYPVVEYLRQRFPQARIDWVVEKKAASLVHAHPYVHRTIEVNMKEWKKRPFSKQTRQEFASFIAELRSEEYDALFDFQGNCKSACITFLARAKNKVGFGFQSVPEKLNCLATTFRANPPRGENMRYSYLSLTRCYFQDDEAFSPSTYPLRLHSIDQEIFQEKVKAIYPNSWLICPFSQWASKELPDATLIEFLTRSKEHFNPQYIFLSGSDDEKMRAERIAEYFPSSILFDRVSLPALQHLMHKVKLVVAMDSLPLHLAGTADCRSICFFGPSSSHVYAPLSNPFVVQGRCSLGVCFDKRCPYLRTCSKMYCIKNISVDSFWDQFVLYYKK